MTVVNISTTRNPVIEINKASMSSGGQINSTQPIVASNYQTTSSNRLPNKISVLTTANFTTTTTNGAGSLVVNPTITTVTSNSNNTKMSNLQANANQHWYDLPKMDNLVDIFTVCCSTAVIFGGLIPYIPQYLKIKRSMSSEGFSTYVCLTLLIANILRICFWFGHPFELPLLIQSFVMIAGMMAMMELCIRVRDKRFAPYSISSIGGPTAINRKRRDQINGKLEEERHQESLPIYSVLSTNSPAQHHHYHSSTSSSASVSTSASTSTLAPRDTIDSLSYYSYHQQLRPDIVETCRPSPSSNSDNRVEALTTNSTTRTCKCDFWDWDYLFSYIKFLTVFTLVVALITFLLLDVHLYIETLGFVAVFAESMLGMPQLARNYRKQSTRGMSVEMVAMWLSGDLFKTLYFILRKAPAQFYVCGSVQVVVDILILGQVLWYRRPIVAYRKLPKTTKQ